MKQFLFFLLTCLLSSCRWSNTPPAEPAKIDGYRPIYVSREEIEKIAVTPPQALKSPGKIYIKDNVLFINEQAKGVHIFDNRDPKNPIKLAFLQIPGNMDIAVRGNTLYADNGRDLLVIDVANPAQPKILNRMKEMFPNPEFPAATNSFFECIDNSKGIVIGWEKVPYNVNQKCYR